MSRTIPYDNNTFLKYILPQFWATAIFIMATFAGGYAEIFRE